jgi:hypothetical protein
MLVWGGKIRCVNTVVAYHIDREGALTTSVHKDYVRKVVESVMTAQRVFAEYISNHQLSDKLYKRIRLHQERQIRFVFSKIRVTSDFSIKEIIITTKQFRSYGAFPICDAHGHDKLMNFLYEHPYMFKLYIWVYSSMRSIKHYQ